MPPYRVSLGSADPFFGLISNRNAPPHIAVYRQTMSRTFEYAVIPNSRLCRKGDEDGRPRVRYCKKYAIEEGIVVSIEFTYSVESPIKQEGIARILRHTG